MDLIARLEAATEDEGYLIKSALRHARAEDWITEDAFMEAMHWASIGAFMSAALTLVSEEWHWTVCDQQKACVWKRYDEPSVNGIISAETPAHALCIAALKARQGDDHG